MVLKKTYQAVFGLYTRTFYFRFCLCEYVHTCHIITDWSSEVSADDDKFNLQLIPFFVLTKCIKVCNLHGLFLGSLVCNFEIMKKMKSSMYWQHRLNDLANFLEPLLITSKNSLSLE